MSFSHHIKRQIFTGLFLIFTNGAQAQVTADSGMTGTWGDPTHDGEGFHVEILGDSTAIVHWFSYDSEGNQRWFVGTGEAIGNQARFSELLSGAGGIFGDQYDSEDVIISNSGSLTITWADCSSAIAEYDVEGITGTQSLQRVTNVLGLECSEPTGTLSAFTGSWFDNTRFGEGFAIEALPNDQAVVYWFSYDTEGQPAWFFGVGNTSGKLIEVDNMYITSGGRFGPGFKSNEVKLESWGKVEIELGCDYGKFDYTALSMEFGTGKQTLTRLTGPGDAECNEAASPNILLVIADDLGLDASAQYGISDQLPTTPVLDEIAASGLVFDNAWSYPTCTPTRASILTGKFGVRTGVQAVGDILSFNDTALPTYLDQNLPEKYANAVIGKWHLGPGQDVNHPNDSGVSHFAGLISGAVDDYFNWQLVVNGDQSREVEYTTSKFVDLAIDWTSDQQQPWFLWLAFNAPHTPFHLPPQDLHNRSLSGTESDIESNPMPYYLAAIEAMDAELGRFLDSMNPADRDNTIIIFLGDNGTPPKVVQEPFSARKAKGSIYQGGINIPFMIRYPDGRRAGERESAMVNTTDLFATISSMAGVNVDAIHDSSSLTGLLSDNRTLERAFQFSESLGDTGYTWSVADGEYKLIESDSGDQELYNLIEDPYESADLIEDQSVPNDTIESLQSIADSIFDF